MTVVNKLISGVDHLDRADLISAAVLELGGSALPDDDERAASSKSPLNQIAGSCLYLISIPDNLLKKTYGSLFKHLARDNCIPLGLLRGTFAAMSMGPKANKMPYVFTNPDRDSEVFSCDRVFVLSTVAMQANRLAVKVINSVLLIFVRQDFCLRDLFVCLSVCLFAVIHL